MYGMGTLLRAHSACTRAHTNTCCTCTVHQVIFLVSRDTTSHQMTV